MLHKHIAEQQQHQRQQKFTSTKRTLLASNAASNTVEQATNNTVEQAANAAVTEQQCNVLSVAAAAQKQQPTAIALTRSLTETTLLSSKNTHSICLQKNVACSNMLPQNALKPKLSNKNATIFTTIKTTTTKLMKAQETLMKLEAVANEMLLSSVNANYSNDTAKVVTDENAVITIDFNSRRRRGRLRLKAEQQQQDVVATEKLFAIKPPPPPATTQKLANSLKTFLPSFSKMLLLYYMLLLLHFASNMLLKLQKTFSRCGNMLRQQQYSLYNVNKLLAKSTANDAAISCSSKTTFATTNNSKQQCKSLQIIAAAMISLFTACCCCCSNSSRRRLPSCSQLISVFLLCTTILPCNNNMLLVSAAKPKSATQTHQQQPPQQQQPQQNQNQLQLYNNHFDGISNFDGVSGGGGVDNELTPPSYQVVSSQTSNEEIEFSYPSSQSEEQLFDKEQSLGIDNEDEAVGHETSNNKTTNDTKTPLFPKDLFTKEQLENGAVVCHILGVIYMFVALAIVCDEFFVPSLDVIIEKLGITDDVAGATFMAAGGSAPELFTSVIGVFVSFDDVGIGTIVGSAVFNILFVIGMCALFSKTVLTLTWWPLFRDCTFYSISLIVLIYFFRDNRIYWWEALILFFIYVAYVVFMKWNVQVERCVKKLITKNKVTRVRSTDQLMPAGNAANSSETSMATQPGGSVTSRAASETRSGPAGGSTSGATGNSSGGTAGSTQTGAKFRHGLLQLMIHTIDPLHDDDVPGKVDEKATQLHAIASLKVLLDATKPQRGGATTSAANHVKINLKETTLADRPNGNIDTTLDSPSLSGRRPSWIEQRVKIQTRKFSIKTNDIEDEPEPLSMAWPDTARKRLTYILVAPLLIPMWLTLPDTRTPKGKKFFAVTFIGSIVWIAAFSYLMVWWANVAGDTARIPPEVMGLTFLAAGTSIPDLITSVIVARKGFGDMAVSSSVGSNIFDVTVGLPIPWLIYGLIYSAPVEVNSVGMVCSITILFMMLIFVVMSIACFRWKMNKSLGFTMFLLYFVFVAVSLMFEYDTIRCPV